MQFSLKYMETIWSDSPGTVALGRNYVEMTAHNCITLEIKNKSSSFRIGRRALDKIDPTAFIIRN